MLKIPEARAERSLEARLQWKAIGLQGVGHCLSSNIDVSEDMSGLRVFIQYQFIR